MEQDANKQFNNRRMYCDEENMNEKKQRKNVNKISFTVFFHRTDTETSTLQAQGGTIHTQWCDVTLQ